METRTLTMAGHQAVAGAARLRSGSCAIPASSPAPAPAVLAGHGAYGHLGSSWAVAVAVEPTTTMVFEDKNGPTRQPSELSP